MRKLSIHSFTASVARAWTQRFESPALTAQRPRAILGVALWLVTTTLGANPSSIPDSQGVYRLPYADGTRVRVFADVITHTPRGRLDLYAVGGEKPYRVVAAAAGRVVAIQDRYSKQQDGRTAQICQQNYVWIEHPNGEWTNYSHLAKDSVTKKAGLKIGDEVNAGRYIGDEGAVGCAMFDHVHFEVALPDKEHPIDSGGFLTDNDNGKRELNPRLYGVPGQKAVKDQTYVALARRASNATGVRHDSSPHRTSFVTVKDGVQLEVPDGRGVGKAIVLLAASAPTARIFDDFAPTLTNRKVITDGRARLIWRRGLFDGVDDQGFNRAFLRFEPQAELFL